MLLQRGEEAGPLLSKIDMLREAIVAPSMLPRLQARRKLGREHAFFESIAEAETWLGWEQDYCRRTFGCPVAPREQNDTLEVHLVGL